MLDARCRNQSPLDQKLDVDGLGGPEGGADPQAGLHQFPNVLLRNAELASQCGKLSAAVRVRVEELFEQ